MAASRKWPSTDPAQGLYDRLKARVEAQGLRDTRVVIGYSGGLDSTVLLHLFSRLRAEIPFDLRAFHVHHGLSPHADDWLRHCASISAQWQIPFIHQHVTLDAAAAESLEARARARRYAAYASLDCRWLVLGHHMDDQAETLLYRLARGAGVHGAAAIPPRRNLGPETAVWRPLLQESRHTLLSYASHHQLVWVDDDSNASLTFDRNWIRHGVLAPLSKRFPHAAASMARAAGHFADAADLLDELAALDAGEAAGGTPALRLPLARMVALSLPRRHNLLRWFLARQGVRPDAAQIVALSQLLLAAPDDAQPCLRLADRCVRRFRDQVWVSGLPAAPVATLVVPGVDVELPAWRGRLHWRRGEIDRSDGRVDATAIWMAKPRQGGERLRMRPGGPSRLIKHLYQEADVPPWLRDAWPLIWRGEQLVAAAGFPTSDPDALSGWLPIWLPDDWPDCPLGGDHSEG
ncbi:tRNA lysidine(34) synthetase TilS [Chitinimonas sp. BJYL2]|uniref:tRNA lysidine(34) synthetase TilS n=1 Tax=Chitinimonas sp. BJYL2 TaxID=2976696 RepID=UPI0022B5BE9C|nr:tRNA lysidine(34) synthetase TilS [Chitinimonas sp. BJYL2]